MDAGTGTAPGHGRGHAADARTQVRDPAAGGARLRRTQAVKDIVRGEPVAPLRVLEELVHKLFQYPERGHRFSTDDILHGLKYGAPGAPGARVADLGSGIGSVATAVAWRCPGARIHTVEAQAIPALLARKSIRLQRSPGPLHHPRRGPAGPGARSGGGLPSISSWARRPTGPWARGSRAPVPGRSRPVWKCGGTSAIMPRPPRETWPRGGSSLCVFPPGPALRPADAGRQVAVADYYDHLALDRALDQVETSNAGASPPKFCTRRAGGKRYGQCRRAAFVPTGRGARSGRIRAAVAEIVGSGLTVSRVSVAASLLDDLAKG